MAVSLYHVNRLRDLIAGVLPSEVAELLPALGDGSATFLDGIFYTDYATSVDETGLSIIVDLVIPGELELGIPGLDAVKLVLGATAASGSDAASGSSGDSRVTLLTAGLYVSKNEFEFRLDNVSVALRFATSILKPVAETAGATPPKYAEITTSGSIVLDENFDLRFEGFSGLSLKPAMIGDSGVVISADNVKLDLSPTSTLAEVKAAGFGDDFIGIYIGEAKVKLPSGLPDLAPEDLILKKCAIGYGGISGILEAKYNPTFDSKARKFTGRGAGELFGVPFGLKDFKLEFKQNALKTSEITGQLLLPFFVRRFEAKIGLDLGGGFTVKVAGAVDSGDSYDAQTGLLTLKKDGVLSFSLESIAFEVKDKVFTAKLGGSLTPLVAGIDWWPTFKINELAIDSEGNVHLDGGWLNLKEQYSIDFHGFKFEITKLGFGKTDDGGKWVGFSGGIKLVEGLPAGASVEGLRVTWYDTGSPKVSFEGIGVEFEVPEALKFKGYVSYKEISSGGKTNHRFDGDIKLDVTALNLTIDAKLVIGQASEGGKSYTYFAIYLGAELPAGIPLWSTGLGLYGVAGLFALQMEPDKESSEEWYEGWYKRPTVGVTDLAQKWTDMEDSLALGAGVTIGTVADNGYMFAGKFLLVIVFPGPIILIEGKANILQERAKLGDDPNFRSLFVLDCRAGNITIGLDALYKYDQSSGALVDIRGGAKAYFDFNDASKFYFNLGEKDPREKRIQAEILSLWRAEAYFMLNAYRLAFGGRVGYDAQWKFGPLKLIYEAWIEANALISWKPAHLYGDLWLHGKVGLYLFGFGLSMSADAGIAADVFDPFHLLAKVAVEVDLPWPLPDFDVDLTLEWGPKKVPPPLPLPLKEIAVEHFKSTASWPLARKTLLLPNYDAGGDGFRDEPGPSTADIAAQDAKAPPASGVPVVPMDCRPHVTFGRAVNDDARVGVNLQPLSPDYEVVGASDPTKQGPVKARYGLREVALHEWVPSAKAWNLVARTADQSTKTNPGAKANPTGVPALFGSWAPTPLMPDGKGENKGQTKLWLWSKNPFDYTRQTGSQWDEWFTARYSNYPCLPTPKDETTCYDFEKLAVGTKLTSPWTHPDRSGLTLSWVKPAKQAVAMLGQTGAGPAGKGYTRGLDFPAGSGPAGPNPITITLPEPCKTVRVHLRGNVDVDAAGYQQDGTICAGVSGSQAGNVVVTFTGDDLTSVVLRARQQIFLLAVCLTTGESSAEALQRQEMVKHMTQELKRWEQTGPVLEPDTDYRLTVVTTITSQGLVDPYSSDSKFSRTYEQTEYAYFRTGGPPGLAKLTVPPGQSSDKWKSGLDDLTRYVTQTVPRTVAAETAGATAKPSLPRPVWRGYDVRVHFGENYVELLYRLTRRDLGLYLYDANNQPVRDAQGRLMVLPSPWGYSGSSGTPLDKWTLDDKDEYWVETINQNTCLKLDTTKMPKNQTLSTPASGQVLAADTVYEARLVPLLFHDDFSEGTGNWKKVDQGTTDGPGFWKTGSVTVSGAKSASYYVEQTSNVYGGTTDGRDPAKPGTLLVHEAAGWTDYRLSVYVRSADDDAVGLAFRYQSATSYYLFAMDRQRRYRRLIRVQNGTYTVLAEDDEAYVTKRDYLVTVEAVGSNLKVLLDGEAILSATDKTFSKGGIALYAWASVGARFTDVRVDDFSQSAPVAYRFKLTTSKYADLAHYLHSYLDETWKIALEQTGSGSGTTSNAASKVTASDIQTALKQAQALPSAAGGPVATPADPETEFKAYDTLVAKVTGKEGGVTPSGVEVSRLDLGGKSVGLMIRGPEPLDWQRTSVRLLSSDRRLPLPGGTRQAGTAKIIGAHLGAQTPNEETVSLLLRQGLSLKGHRIEYLSPPGPLAAESGNPVLFEDDFEAVGGTLYKEAFGTGALGRYSIIDQGKSGGPSEWTAENAAIRQKSPIGGSAASPELRPGTVAVTGQASWGDLRLTAKLRADSDGAVGVVFRYQDESNYYRFSVDPKGHGDGPYRRLLKVSGQTVKVLWQDGTECAKGKTHDLVIEVHGGCLVGWVDSVFAFSVTDPSPITKGRAGFYSSGCSGARFEGLRIESLTATPLLWDQEFGSLALTLASGTIKGLTGGTVIESATGTVIGTATGTATGSAIGSEAGGATTGSTYETNWSPESSTSWKDIRLGLSLRPEGDGAFGVWFRYTDSDNYYYFVSDRKSKVRKLVKRSAGKETVLWKDSKCHAGGFIQNLTVEAIGGALAAYLNGSPVCSVRDDELTSGKVACYAEGGQGTTFGRVVVTDQTRAIGSWTLRDDGDREGPSVWRSGTGTLVQSSNIWGHGPGGASTPDRPGTMAIAGSVSWQDYRFTARLRSDDNDGIGLVFRYRDPRNYYRLHLDAQTSERRLVKVASGKVTTLWQKKGGYPLGQEMTLTVDAVGSRLTGYLGTERLFQVIDTTHSSGKIGLYCWANTGARFEAVEVRRAPLEAKALFADSFSLGSSTGFKYVTVAAGGAAKWKVEEGALRQTNPVETYAVAGEAKWTNVIFQARVRSEAAGVIGLLFRYQDGQNHYRFTLDRQKGWRRLDKVAGGKTTNLWVDKTTSFELKRDYELTMVAAQDRLRGYVDGVPAFEVKESSLQTGRVALYCSATTGARFSGVRVYPTSAGSRTWLLDEDFTSQTSGRWTDAKDTDGKVSGEAAWDDYRLTAGFQLGTKNTQAGRATAIAKGTALTVAEIGDALGGIRLVEGAAPAGSTTLAEGAAPGAGATQDWALTGEAGAMFRYVDPGNHYRFVVSTGGGRRLMKRVNGKATTLWSDAGKVEPGRPYLFTVDCIGSRLTGYLDGARLFEVEDGDLPAGKVGVVGKGPARTTFTEVRVAEPVWNLYHLFSTTQAPEPKLEDGTRVTIHAGSQAAATGSLVKPDAGLERRFAASAGDTGRVRLPAKGVQLRLVSSQGLALHSRWFLPDSAYKVLTGAVVLRRRDGTGFFVFVPPSGTAWAGAGLGPSYVPPEQLRLEFTYRRQRKTGEPEWETLTRGGSDAPETVVLDVP